MRILLGNKNSNQARSITLGVFSKVFLSVILMGIPFLTGASLYAALMQEQVIDKAKTQEVLTKIIMNNGDLRSAKHALSSQEIDVKLSTILSNKQNFYQKNTPLSTVLEDIRVNAFIEDDLEILGKVEKIIREHEELNPFDALLPSQRDLFVNVRIKSEEEYLKISNDINNIAEELHNKNQLVDEYLSDSKTSYWLSIVGLLFSLSIGGTQIYWQISSKKYEVKVEEENIK